GLDRAAHHLLRRPAVVDLAAGHRPLPGLGRPGRRPGRRGHHSHHLREPVPGRPTDKDHPPERNLYAEAAEHGYLVTDSTGQPYPLDKGGFDAYLVDLTDAADRDWFADVIATEVLTDG